MFPLSLLLFAEEGGRRVGAECWWPFDCPGFKTPPARVRSFAQVARFQRADFRSRRCALTCLQLPLSCRFAGKEQIIADSTFPVYRWIRWLLLGTNGYKGNQRAEDPASRTIDCIPGQGRLPLWIFQGSLLEISVFRGPVLLRPDETIGRFNLFVRTALGK